MPAAYDLIILGNTPTAHRAAKTARHHHARTALITFPPATSPLAPLLTTLHHWPELARSLNLTPTDLPAYLDRLTIQQTPELSELINLGVDVIRTSVTFRHHPKLSLHIPGNDRTRDRRLTARAYLLALPPETIELSQEKLTPNLLDGINHWTIADFPSHLIELLNRQSLTILGTSPTAIALAQALQQLGQQITIVTTHNSLLPHLQPKIQTALQSVLQSQGITLHLNTTVNKITQSSHNTLHTTEGEITSNTLLLGTPATRLNETQLTQLNLTTAQIRRQSQIIGIDDETIVLDRVLHALKLPGLSQASPPVITTTLTNPTLITIGLSEKQAKARHGRIYVLTQSLNTHLKAQVLNQTNGICELIVRSNGTIVGAQVFAAQAEEWAGILTLAIQQKIPIQSLAACPLPTGSFAESINDLARAYQFRKANQKWTSKFIESWFAWLREISN